MTGKTSRVLAQVVRPVHRQGLIEPLESRVLFASVPAGFVDEQVVTGLSNPTAMEFAPDGRLFVTQQGGALRVIKNGVLLATPFTSFTVDSSGERGLLGVAFDPNYATNRFVYVYHTVPAPAGGGSAHNRVTRLTADPANPDVAVAGSATPILDLDNLGSATNHNGGAIHFGVDGKLYVAVGENASSSNAQTLSNRLGKMLRINADGSIPADNPFFTTASGANRAIWSLGLRNPYTFAVQPGTGLIHVNDVGQSTWEEIDVGIAGANYGWGNAGGNIEGPRTSQPLPTIGTYVDPLHAYRHPTTGSDPTTVGIAIAGGAFYNPAVPNFPIAFAGDYFFADLGSGTSGGNWIRKLEAGTSNSTLFATGLNTPVDLKVGPDGKLYYLERGNNGRVARVAAVTPSVTGVRVNDGTAQRSSVTSVTVTFSRAVTLDAGAITLVGRGGAGAGTTATVSPTTGPATSFTLTFTGSPIVNGSLADGVYDVSVIAEKVHDAAIPAQTPPSLFTTQIHRMLADADGDREVGLEDFSILASHYGQGGQGPGTGDFDGNGVVDLTDFGLLAGRYGTRQPAAAPASVAPSNAGSQRVLGRQTTAGSPLASSRTVSRGEPRTPSWGQTLIADPAPAFDRATARRPVSSDVLTISS